MSARLDCKSPLTTYCCKCRKGRADFTKPRYAARSKKCGRWVAGCKSCFAKGADAKAAVVAHLRQHGGCGFCIDCMINGIGGEINVFTGGQGQA